jgi:AIPR protein
MRDFAKKLEAYFKTFPVETRLYYERRPHQYDSLDVEKIRIITHQNLVRAVGAMFLGLPQITTRRFSQLSAMVGTRMFCDTDKQEPYFVAALALYRLERLFKDKTVEGKYKAARYQILLTARLIIDPTPLPKMNANDMTKRCHVLAEYLQNDEACGNILKHAIQVIDAVVPGWNRDTIRNESSTRAIFGKFGQQFQAET